MDVEHHRPGERLPPGVGRSEIRYDRGLERLAASDKNEYGLCVLANGGVKSGICGTQQIIDCFYNIK